MSVLRPLKTIGGYPSRILGYDTETHAHDADATVMKQILTLGYTAYWEGGEKVLKDIFTTSDEFWDKVEDLSRVCPPPKFGAIHEDMLIVMAYNVGFDMMVLETERQLSNRGWMLDPKTALFPKPFFMEFVKDGKRFALLDLGNFYGTVSLAKIGKALGFPKGEPEGCGTCKHCKNEQTVLCHVYRPDRGCVPGSYYWNDLAKYCEIDTEIVVKGMKTWIEFCTENQAGPFRKTAAGQALADFRSNFLDEDTVYPTRNPGVVKLERDSYMGGLTDVWRRGEFNHDTLDDSHKVDCEGFKKVDVNSMHAGQMATQLYPEKMIRYMSGPGLAKLSVEKRITGVTKAINQGFGVTVRVKINTDLVQVPDVRWAAMAPYKYEGKLVYPVGEFETVLTTREAERCLKLGIIADVLELAVYKMGPLFNEYVKKYSDLKVKYGIEGNEAFRTVAKAFLCNLYGKWGQRNQVWEEVPAEMANGVRNRMEGQNVWVTNKHVGDLTKNIEVRSFMNHLKWTQGDLEEGPSSFCAISAHIVADSRVQLLDYRQVAGYDESYYADTDSLIVTERGYQNLVDAGTIDDHALGMLKLEEESLKIRITAPKDYEFNGHTKRKGVKAKAEVVGYAIGRAANGEWIGRQGESGDGLHPIFRQPQFRSLNGAMRDGDMNTAVVQMVEKMATGAYNKGVIQEDGWIMPHVIKKQE